MSYARQVIEAVVVAVVAIACSADKASAADKPTPTRTREATERNVPQRERQPLPTDNKRYSTDAILYLYQAQLYTVRTDGSRSARLTKNLPDGVKVVWARWSPDGKRIAFCAQRFDDDANRWRSSVYLINGDGSSMYACIPEDDDPEVRYTSLDWLDRDTLVLTRWHRQGTFAPDADLWTFEIGHKKLKPLSVEDHWNVFEIDASNDGKHVFYIHKRRDNQPSTYAIYRYDIESGEHTSILTSLARRNPAVSPDGSKLLFTRDLGSEHTFVANADGSEQRQITVAFPEPNPPVGTQQESGVDPTWWVSGDEILYVRRHGGGQSIVRRNLETDEITTILTVGQNLDRPQVNPAYREPKRPRLGTTRDPRAGTERTRRTDTSRSTRDTSRTRGETATRERDMKPSSTDPISVLQEAAKVDRNTLRALQASGMRTVDQIAKADRDSLMKRVKGLSAEDAASLISAARAHVANSERE